MNTPDGGAVGLGIGEGSTPPITRSASPVRRFDPFAPLDSPNAGTLNSDGTSLTPSLPSTSTPNFSRENRPASLYLPMEGTGTTPTWPFKGGSSAEHLFAPPTPASGPLSPSSIHPSYGETAYGDRPSSPPHHTDSYTPSQAPPQSLHSGIPVNAAQGAYASSTAPAPSVSPRVGYEQDAPPRHAATYSLGTHALLSSRASTKARLAASMDTPTAWLVLYFSFNLGLTLYNKLVLQGFPFPWTLTGIQMLSGTIGTQIALNRGFFTQARLTTKEGAIMVAFSVLYTVNIAVSNLSLHLVTVPFHQVVRAMTPLFTIILSVVLLHKRYSRATYLSLCPVMIGVFFATYGDYYFTAWGFILTLFGTLLAALKTIVTNRIQVGRLKLHPLDLLVRMSPLAFMQCVICAWYSGELERVRIYGATEMTQRKATALLMNGVIAFGLNVVSFTANKKTSALTMTVAANVKQVLTIILAVIIFNLALNPTNVFGITLTLAGGAWYAKVELQEKSRQNALAASRLGGTTSEKRALTG